MAGRFSGWFERRVMRAEPRESEIVSSTGSGVVRWGRYLEEGPGGRIFWIVATGTQLALFVGLSGLLLTLPWTRPDTTEPFVVGLEVVLAALSLWCALVWQGSLRAMVRERSVRHRPPQATQGDETDDGQG